MDQARGARSYSALHNRQNSFRRNAVSQRRTRRRLPVEPAGPSNVPGRAPHSTEASTNTTRSAPADLRRPFPASNWCGVRHAHRESPRICAASRDTIAGPTPSSRAQQIAVADQQAPPATASAGGGRNCQPRRTSSSVSPCGPRSTTCSGIWPRAWVEQLRHGSKQRITASTRLSMPSAILSPWTKRSATC